jgi:hypothetical protein
MKNKTFESSIEVKPFPSPGYQVRENVGSNRRPYDINVIAAELEEERARYQKESRRVASLGLDKSPENQYNKHLGVYVPRSRLIGFDGIVRAGRTATQEPLKRPKDSTFMKMTRAFTSLRRAGVDARWNIMVPEADTFTGYMCFLPEPYVGPRVTHWRAADITNSSLSTGVQWAQDWEPVQDSITFESFNGAEEIFINTLAENGLRAEISGEFDEHKSIDVIFRGEGRTCLARWEWTNYALSDKKIEAPAIGSLVTDLEPYLAMTTR